MSSTGFVHSGGQPVRCSRHAGGGEAIEEYRPRKRGQDPEIGARV